MDNRQVTAQTKDFDYKSTFHVNSGIFSTDEQKKLKMLE